MASLKSVLSQTSERFLKAGGQVSPAVKKALRAHRQQQKIIFLSLAVLLLGAVSFCAYLLLAQPAKGRVLAPFLGIGSGGAFPVLLRVWRDWTQTDLLLILIEEASESEITKMINKLIVRL